MESNIMIGRQPIVTLEDDIIGYELLFRSHTENINDLKDDRYATAKVVTDALNAIGLNELIGSKTAFINVDKKFLLNPAIEAIPADRFIFEILETVIIDDEIIQRLKELHAKGYLFALDDFDFSVEQLENFEQILPFLHIVKIDLLACNGVENIQHKIEFFKSHKVDLLAEKVESLSEYKACIHLGFSYFQGYFFAKPEIIEGKKLSPEKLSLVQIIKHLIAEEPQEVVEKEIIKSPEISISLLKYLNSASFGIKREIGSIRQAITLLGTKSLLKWVVLLLYSIPDGQSIQSKALMETVLLRSEFMKLLTLKLGNKSEVDKAYFIGLISMLDVILNKDIDSILKELHFDEQIEEAILHNKSLLGKTLVLSKSMQQQQAKSDPCKDINLDIECAELTEIMTDAYVNVMKLTQEL